MKMKYCSACNTGLKRRNEDAIGARVFEDCDKSLFIVCDGMSGLHSGDVASQTVVDVFLSTWERHRDVLTTGQLLGMAVKQAKAEIDKLSRYDVGTTMVMAATDGEEMLIAHLGDSRAYYLRPDEGVLYQTQDHITIGEEGWPYVSKGFFYFRDVEKPTVRKFQCKTGDRILLCSDGVSGCYKGSALTDLQMTINEETVDKMADGVIFLLEKGAVVHPNVAYEKKEWSEDSLLEYGKQLNKLIEYYYEHKGLPLISQFKHDLNEYAASIDNHKTQLEMCGSGNGFQVFDTDGTPYPCHMLSPLVFDGEKLLV